MSNSEMEARAQFIAQNAFAEYTDLLKTLVVEKPDPDGPITTANKASEEAFVRVVSAAVASVLIEKENIVGELRPLVQTIPDDDDDRVDAIVDDPADLEPERDYA